MHLPKAKITLLATFLATCLNPVFSQLRNQVFDQKDTIVPKDSQVLRLNAEIFTFLRNTEYFDIEEKGQTYFGNMLQLHLSYQPHNNILIKAGLQTRQDYGNTNFTTVQPVICISVFKQRWRFNLGMLQGTTNYGMIEPMYNIDRAITNRVENGLQSIYRGHSLYMNNFLVWNEPTYRTTMNQERFMIGSVINKTLLQKKRIYTSLPFNMTVAHRGGQLNSNPTPIYSRMNLAAGLKFNITFSPKLTIRTENYFLHSEDFSPAITQPFKNGNASWHTLAIDYKRFELMFNYWAGREYQSPVGSLIYNNYDFYDPYQSRRVRHMLMSRFMYTQAFNKNMFFDLRLEPFYDFEYARIQYSYSIYLRINLATNICRLKTDRSSIY